MKALSGLRGCRLVMKRNASNGLITGWRSGDGKRVVGDMPTGGTIDR